MAMNEPMNDGRLARLRDEVDALADNDPQANMRITRHVRQMRELLAEVDRLRAREQALAAENAAMRPVVEAVTEDTTDSETGDCCFCGWSGYPHERNCPTAQARAFVAAHPATDTAAGEAESEA